MTFGTLPEFIVEVCEGNRRRTQIRIAYANPLLDRAEGEPVDERFLRAPIASGYLAAYTRGRRADRDSHDVISSHELARAHTVGDTVDLLFRSDPQVVALSVYVWNARTVAGIISELRRRRTGATLVLGGPEVQYTPDLALRRFDADFICTGEGESAFLGLVERLAANRSSARHAPPPGMASESAHGGPAPLIADLDAVPSPFRDGTIDVPPSGWVDIETVRGCPFSCSFCLYGKNLANVRAFSHERIRTDVNWLLNNGATDVYFLDPTFNLPREHCRQILQLLMMANGDRRARIYVEARAEIMDEDLADDFVRAGITSVEVGLQAVQPSALKLMHRGLGRKRFVAGCESLRERGIAVDIGVIVGLPGDSAETIRATVDYATQDLLGEVSAYRLRVLPGSDYWTRARELGLEHATDPPYFVTRTTSLSATALDAIEAEVAETLEPHNAEYREYIGRERGSREAKIAKKEPASAMNKPTTEPAAAR